jgi:hypothetical protein
MVGVGLEGAVRAGGSLLLLAKFVIDGGVLL